MNRDDYPRCKTCSWWIVEMHMDNGWGRCALAASDSGQPETSNVLAWAEDSETWSARLNTHETYGCVQHAPKQEW